MFKMLTYMGRGARKTAQLWINRMSRPKELNATNLIGVTPLLQQ